MKADALENAIDFFNELQPLVFSAEGPEAASLAASKDFYVERPDNPLDALKVHLLRSGLDEKILLTGHMGSGKSTELNRLAADTEIQSRFLVVKYSAREKLNILDIDYLDFLLSLAATLFIESANKGIAYQSTILDKFSKWIGYVKQGEGVPQDLDAGRAKSAKVKHFYERILTVLVREVAVRDAVRKSVERNITELVNVINLIVEGIRTELKAGRELLVIIDDLEKIPDLDRAEKLFRQAGGYMIAPRCKIVYTMPIALYYSVSFKEEIANTFNQTYFLRNVKLFERGKSELQDMLGGSKKLMEKVLENRMDLRLIDEMARAEAIRCSGGVVRELVRIIKDATIGALTRRRTAISRELVDATVIKLRNEYSRGLSLPHYQVLDQVLADRAVADTQTQMALYHARVLLEYENAERWNAVNPIVAPLVERYRKQVAAVAR